MILNVARKRSSKPARALKWGDPSHPTVDNGKRARRTAKAPHSDCGDSVAIRTGGPSTKRNDSWRRIQAYSIGIYSTEH